MDDFYDNNYSDYGRQAKVGRDGRTIRTRRKRTDMNGRDYRCDQCSNAYFSSAALYTHKKSKHEHNGSLRKRENGDYSASEDETVIEPQKPSPSTDFTKIFQDLKNILISTKQLNYRFRLMEFREDELFKTMSARSKLGKTEVEQAVDLLAEYLLEKKNVGNFKTFGQLLKVIYLLADSIKRDVESSTNGVTVWSTAENVPLFINSFLGFYIKEEGINEIVTRDEAVKVIENLSKWAFEKEYTNFCLTESKFSNI